MRRRPASRTAVLVCQRRAVAHGHLARGRFSDPTAFDLLRADERAPVERARSEIVPRSWAERIDLEMLQAGAELMAARTVVIDDAVRSVVLPQVVDLGAGLDGRAWRVPDLAQATFSEVDHPASQQDKRARELSVPIRHPRSLRNGRVTVAELDHGRPGRGSGT